jgi:drug/metabolite transporter (DMT)-like permease
MSERILGILLVTISALVFSTVGLFIKSVSAGSWEVIFWRGVFAVAFSFIYVLARGRIKREIFNMGKGGLLVAFVGAVATSAFVPAFKLTTIANVTLIYAATPMIAAILAFAFVGERLSRAAIVGIGLAFIGVAIIVFGSLGQLNFTGDMLRDCAVPGFSCDTSRRTRDAVVGHIARTSHDSGSTVWHRPG